MHVLKLAAFSSGTEGGNPAGVVIGAAMPADDQMQRIAAEVGFSETAFAAGSGAHWRVRYFSQTAEVPFCGHATIALGAALAQNAGDGVFQLALNNAAITVEGRREGDLYAAALQSPPTRSTPATASQISAALDLFGLQQADLDPRVPPANVHAGADHLVLLLRDRATLAAMRYDIDLGRALMAQHGWLTILLGHAHAPQQFSTRNAFAVGGVYEDPATGAASAALAGYLRDLGWPHGGVIDIAQGDDMGIPCRIRAALSDQPGASIRLSGTVRPL